MVTQVTEYLKFSLRTILHRLLKIMSEMNLLITLHTSNIQIRQPIRYRFTITPIFEDNSLHIQVNANKLCISSD